MIVHGVNEHRSRGTLRFCLIPVGCQILPARVLAFDQPHFLFATPALQLFLAINCVSYVVEAFPVYEACAIVVVGETLKSMVLMLRHPLTKVVGHAYVQSSARVALHHVHVVDALVAYSGTPRLNTRSLDCAKRLALLIVLLRSG